MDSPHEPIIPGLPDDLALRCLARVSHGFHGLLETVSKKWREVTRGMEYANFKAREGWSGDWLFVLTEGSENQWVAYDPEADRWHPIPKMPRTHPDWKHTGFSCVCVGDRFLVIGGAYASSDPGFPHQKPIITNEVYQFDPFRKEWTMVSSMQTPRSHFACCVISGKVYVAGGRNLSCPRGLTLAECYNPLSNKWEELPPMPNPQMDCIGLSYNGKFHVLNDQVGLLDQNSSEVFWPLSGLWNTVEDNWPFSRAMQVAVQVIKNDRVYTIVDWGESLIKTRDTAKGEWYNVGKVPSVFLPDHSRPLEVFDYGFAGLGYELYVLGGKVLKWEESGAGRFDIVKLGLVRVCDPSKFPLKWRETRPMCQTASGSILGCASLKESSVSQLR
ncbi:F-box/kelch-repeat protein At1g16250 [Syzygium oleosum]|uniref:F-box/kelch-repeat protein At1g16250 n=1 Tax=Syzygium oleosum TaxID=219896 RepID=UPI0011D1B788|nr:F-box/kelch-repeat protein At1g16250 [Syzygium oleosum]XP_056168471.1 F-box/kelch-repeat protein At1g16250 [Syzygium oleosum]